MLHTLITLLLIAAEATESPLHHDNGCSPNAILQVVLLVLITLLLIAIAANRGHVDHSVAELHKRAALHGDV